MLAPGDGAGARLELAQIERLDQIVVGPEVERIDLVVDLHAGRQHQNWNAVLVGAQVTQEAHAGAIGQADVEDDEIIGIETGKVLGIGQRRRVVADMPQPREVRKDRLRNVLGVLDDQDSQRCVLSPAVTA